MKCYISKRIQNIAVNLLSIGDNVIIKNDNSKCGFGNVYTIMAINQDKISVKHPDYFSKEYLKENIYYCSKCGYHAYDKDAFYLI